MSQNANFSFPVGGDDAPFKLVWESKKNKPTNYTRPATSEAFLENKNIHARFLQWIPVNVKLVRLHLGAVAFLK